MSHRSFAADLWYVWLATTSVFVFGMLIGAGNLAGVGEMLGIFLLVGLFSVLPCAGAVYAARTWQAARPMRAVWIAVISAVALVGVPAATVWTAQGRIIDAPVVVMVALLVAAVLGAAAAAMTRNALAAATAVVAGFGPAALACAGLAFAPLEMKALRMPLLVAAASVAGGLAMDWGERRSNGAQAVGKVA